MSEDYLLTWNLVTFCPFKMNSPSSSKGDRATGKKKAGTVKEKRFFWFALGNETMSFSGHYGKAGSLSENRQTTPSKCTGVGSRTSHGQFTHMQLRLPCRGRCAGPDTTI